MSATEDPTPADLRDRVRELERQAVARLPRPDAADVATAGVGAAVGGAIAATSQPVEAASAAYLNFDELRTAAGTTRVKTGSPVVVEGATLQLSSGDLDASGSDKLAFPSRTSDPSSTSPGDAWYRSDNEELRVETQNNGTIQIPTFSTGSSSSGVYEFLRLETGSGTRYLPVADTADARFSWVRVQSQNHGVLAFHDDDTLAVPPSSAQNRYEMAAGSGTTLADSEGTNDLSTSGGITWISDNDLTGDYGVKFDGSDDVASGSALTYLNTEQNWTIAFTIDLSSTPLPATFGSIFIANEFNDGSDTERVSIGPDADSSGGVSWDIDGTSGESGNESISLSSFSGKVRICLVWTPSAIDPYVNASSESLTGGSTQQAGTSGKVTLGGAGGGNNGEVLLDDVIFYNAALSSSEIQKDYDIQPWS